MVRARLLLSLVMLVSVVLFFVSFDYIKRTSNPNEIAGMVFTLGAVASPILFQAALFIFAFSFFRVYQSANGQLVYDPQNFYWRSLLRLLNENPKDSISLCGVFWRTALLVFVVEFLSVMGVGVIYATGLFIYVVLTEGFSFPGLSTKSIALLVSGVSLMLAIFLGNNVPHKSIRKSLAWVLVVFALAVVPIYMAGIFVWLKVVGSVLGLFVVVFGGVFGAVGGVAWLFSKLPSSDPDSLFSRYYRAFKKGLCPIMVAKSP